MAKTRSMTRNQNHDASSRKRFKTSDDGGLVPWSYLNHDVLLLVMMQLGIVDYLAFSGVCKSWRSLALSNRNRFMASRQPMSIFMSTRAKKDCYLDDFEGRKFKTILPNSTGRTCVGLTCGYLIMFGRKTHDFWLVNPITRHELHFPVLPFYVGTNPARVRAILVFSPSMSAWVFVISLRFSRTISFSLAGEQACWNHLSSDFTIRDLHAFKGKIYTINTGSLLCEMRLNPKPTLTLLKIKNFPKLHLLHPEFVSSGENLYVMGCISADLYMAQELDFDKMKWMSPKKTIGEYALFLGNLKCGAAIKPETWADPRTQFERSAYLIGSDKSQKGRSFTANMWYFPHDCVNVNLLKE